MMMQLKYLEAIREMEKGTLFNAETAEVVDWCTVTPKDGFALLIREN